MSVLRESGLHREQKQKALPPLWGIGFQKRSCGGNRSRAEENPKSADLRSLRQAGLNRWAFCEVETVQILS